MLIRNKNLWKTLLIELVALNDPLYLDENSITIVLLLSSAASLNYRRMDFFSLDLVGIFFRPWWRNFLKLTSGLTAPANTIISISSTRECNITDVVPPSPPQMSNFLGGFSPKNSQKLKCLHPQSFPTASEKFYFTYDIDFQGLTPLSSTTELQSYAKIKMYQSPTHSFWVLLDGVINKSSRNFFEYASPFQSLTLGILVTMSWPRRNNLIDV